MWKPAPFDIVEIRALDHTEGRKPYEFVAYGRIAKVEDDFYLLESWTAPEKHGAVSDWKSNRVCGFTIIRSTIIEMKLLGYVE